MTQLAESVGGQATLGLTQATSMNPVKENSLLNTAHLELNGIRLLLFLVLRGL